MTHIIYHTRVALMAVALGTVAVAPAQQRLNNSRIAINNPVVQRIDDKILLAFDANLDSLQLKSNRSLVFTPVVVSANGDSLAAFRSVMVNGRRQHIMYKRGAMDAKYPGALEYRHHNGQAQSFQYTDIIPYQEWMRNSIVGVNEDLCGCGDLLAQETTPLLRRKAEVPVAPWLAIVPAVNERKARKLEGRAYLDFPVNKTVIYPNYRRNPQELKKIVETINQVKENRDVALDTISIHGYASPEGSYQNNTRLAAGRAAALRNYVKGLFHFDDRIVRETSTPEDWDGLRDYLANNDIANRDQLLSIANSDLDPDARDAQMKRQYPTEYAYLLKEVYPALRHSDYVVNYTIRPFDFEESKQIYQERPEDLSTYEIYRLAEDCGLDTPEGRDRLYTAARLYPTDGTAQLLAAQAALQAGDANRAAGYATLGGDTPQAAYVWAAIALRNGDMAEAERQLLKAQQGGVAEAAPLIEAIQELK